MSAAHPGPVPAPRNPDARGVGTGTQNHVPVARIRIDDRTVGLAVAVVVAERQHMGSAHSTPLPSPRNPNTCGVCAGTQNHVPVTRVRIDNRAVGLAVAVVVAERENMCCVHPSPLPSARYADTCGICA